MEAEELKRREEIEQRNEEERQKVFQEIQEKEEKAKERKKEQEKNSFFPKMQKMFQKRTKKLKRPKNTISMNSVELTDFPDRDKEEEEEKPKEAKEAEETEIPVSTPQKVEADNTIEVVPKSYTEAMSMINGSVYALIYITIPAKDYLSAKNQLSEYRKTVEKGGRSTWKENFFPCETDYVVVLRNCRQNKNGIEKECRKFLNLIQEDETDYTVLYEIATPGKDTLPKDALKQLQRDSDRQERRWTHEHPEYNLKRSMNVDISELTKQITKSVEATAVEQAKRQFERQIEEGGEIDEEEEIVIKTAEEMSADEYESYLSDEQRNIKEQARSQYIDDDLLVEQVLHNIKRHNTSDDPLYLIAIVSSDLNTLIILEDFIDFECLCEEQDIKIIQCSYIYALSKSGGHWYGISHATKEIEHIFDAFSELIQENNGVFKKEILYSVPNINIFKDIYIQ
jgi:hypothetical protein